MASYPNTAAVTLVYYNLISFYIELVGWSIFLYDFLLQSGREVDLLWRRKFTWATMLYMTARYALLTAYAIPIIANIGPEALKPECIPPSFQTFLTRFAESMDILAQTGIAAVMALRTYAIYGRSFKILALVGSLGLAVPVIGFWITVSLTAGSHAEQSDGSIPFRSMMLSLFALVFDIVIIGLTIRLILWDGSIYFGAISATHLLNILLFWLAPRGLCGIGIPPSRSISVVMVCRFVLNLRERCYSFQDPPWTCLSPLPFVASTMPSGNPPHPDGGPLHLPPLGFEGAFQFSFIMFDDDACMLGDDSTVY